MVISKQRIDISKQRIAVITLDGNRIERVPRFKYLGCWLNEEWDPDVEIKIIIEIARGVFQKMKGLVCGRGPRFETRWRVVRCYVLLYGVEALDAEGVFDEQIRGIRDVDVPQNAEDPMGGPYHQ